MGSNAYRSPFLALGAGLCVTACVPSEPNELAKLGTVRMSINEQGFELWIADTDDERARGLMFVTAEEMAALPDGTRRGMIFIFDHDTPGSFWMKNTIIPLDIAYVKLDGTVDETHTMAALDDRINQYPPKTFYRFAIEVNANVLTELGVKAGDKLDLPTSVLNPTP